MVRMLSPLGVGGSVGRLAFDVHGLAFSVSCSVLWCGGSPLIGVGGSVGRLAFDVHGLAFPSHDTSY